MPLGECANHHKYNKDKYGDTCPICGLVTKKAKEDGKTPEEIEAMLKIPEGQYVCAWLVCIEGINKGRSYLIHPGKNFLGSGDDMDIQILGDDKVDRYRHAVLAYDEKSLRTVLLPGESKGLAYLEGAAVYAPKHLDAYMRIEVGNSKFLFLPFCGKEFDWNKGD
ncbi:MAG: FHA domain-containing protein [Firmicutes bacterium]|nr:FHA domain-containing protein [Bacillota bacterium]